jgi:hypothetical protein
LLQYRVHVAGGSSVLQTHIATRRPPHHWRLELPFLCKLRVVVVMQLDQLLGDADQVVVATAAELDEEAVGGDPGGRL